MRRAVRLTPREARLLVRYLDGVDDVVTSRLIGGLEPDEPHLTHLLCEMLDDNLASLSTLSYPLRTLKEDFGLEGRPLNLSLTIEAKRYPPHIEGRVTFADLGVVVSYRDNLIPSSSFERGGLFQAKRLHRSAHSGAFTLYDTFKYFDREQLRGLAERERSDLIRKDRYDCSWDMSFCFYLFYCPRPQAYDRQSQEDLRCYAIPTFKEYYFHHPELSFHELAELNHLFETASDPTRHFPAVLTSRIGWLVDKYFEERDGKLKDRQSHESLLTRHVYERLWDDVMPLSWFLVYRMLLGNSGSCGLNALRLVRGQLGDSDEVTVVPRYVITLAVEVGTRRG